MRAFFKHISLFAFLLVGIAILSHAIIPHDHHYGNTVETNHHKKDSNNFIHCYFLNHIDSDKIVNNNFLKIVKQLPNFIALNSYKDSIIKTFIGFIHHNTINTFFLDVIPSLLPIRGSPIS